MTGPSGALERNTRQTLVNRLASQLEAFHYPRLALLTIVTASGFAAFLASYALLLAGLHSMPVRYGFAALGGYLAFLALVRLWVERYSGPSVQLPDATPVDLDFTSVPGGSFDFGGGGGFSGGGAGRSFDAPEAVSDPLGIDSIDLVPDADESAMVMIPLLLFGVLVVGLVSTLSVLWAAPALLAEVFLDAVITGAVYRKLKNVPSQHWAYGVFRRTWKPMFTIVVTLILAAALAQWLQPAADSIGDFFRVQG